MRKIAVIVSAALLALLPASCGKKQLETTYDKQESNIQKIVESLTKSNPDAVEDYIDGSVRVTVAQGSGEALEKDGAVSFYYAGYFITSSSLSSSNVFVTNNENFANSIKWRITDSTAFRISTVNLAEDDIVEGLRNGLVGVKGGDECYVLFSGKHGFGKRKIGIVPERSALAYHLWIKSVSNN